MKIIKATVILAAMVLTADVFIRREESYAAALANSLRSR